jgi:hypothetical protein
MPVMECKKVEVRIVNPHLYIQLSYLEGYYLKEHCP